jgi:ActR/RegA family two-component response regulator
MSETILIVDDEEPVRRTFREWLDSARLECTVLSAADAEEALRLANRQTIDLAILDWNLGAGNDGLQLLEDLYLFNPGVVAIMITGYAHQATPLAAMRMGIRDYLDKNQDLDRTTFLTAVQRQLERIRPAKRERQLHQSLLAFREALEKVLPLVRSASALHDPLPLPEAIRGLIRFLLRITAARDGVLLVRGLDAQRQSAEVYRAYDASGTPLTVALTPFSQSIAGSVSSMQRPCAMTRLEQSANQGSITLQPFERERHALLAVPLEVGPGVRAVLELFDKQDSRGNLVEEGFTADDQRLVGATAAFGVELLRQALAERQTQRVLFDAVEAALRASESVTESLQGTPAERLEQPPPPAVLDQLREGLRATTTATPRDADETLRLIEAIRVLALRHGRPAIQHCIALVDHLRTLLDTVANAAEDAGLSVERERP